MEEAEKEYAELVRLQKTRGLTQPQEEELERLKIIGKLTLSERVELSELKKITRWPAGKAEEEFVRLSDLQEKGNITKPEYDMLRRLKQLGVTPPKNARQPKPPAAAGKRSSQKKSAKKSDGPSYRQLQAALKKLRLKQTGSRDVLIERLKEADEAAYDAL